LDPVREVAFTFLANPPDTTSLIPEMTLKTADKVFPEWMRFCCSVHYSGHFSEQLEILLKQTLLKLEELAEEVHEKSNGYPNNSINGYVWFNGAIVRNWSDALSYLFEMRQKPQEKATVLQYKCKVTCSIMSHYHQLVGPDMIEAAAALIVINDTETAKKYYQAVIADFEPLARLWQGQPEEPITADDLISLKALLDAYDGFTRLEANYFYSDQRQKLEQLIQNSENLSL
jgi:hypothetical protein